MKGLLLMKRIFASMLVGSCLFGLAGCSDHSAPSLDTTDAQSQTPDDYAEDQKYDATTPAPVPTKEECVNVVEQGVKNDGSDCTARLKNNILRHKKVFLPAGTYKISETLILPDNSVIMGEEGTVIEVEGDIDLFLVEGEFISKTEPAKRAQNIGLYSLTIQTEIPRNRYAIKAYSVNGLTLDRVNVTNLGGVLVDVVYDINVFAPVFDPVGDAGVFSDACLSENIRVTNCTIDCGNYTDSGATAVYLQYLNRFTVTDCTVSNAWQGIQFWGGDSEYDRGGKAENGYRAKNGYITRCKASDIGGGVWGSMGENITVTHCDVARCIDVGIDFEGCHNATASYNKAADCKNGNYATFQYCTGKVIFSYNESYLGAGFNQHFFNSNATQMAFEQDITFDHCRFESVDLASVNCQSAMAKFTFTNNTCINTTVNTSGRNIWSVTIENNNFQMNLPLSAQKIAVIYATNHNNQGRENDLISVQNNTVTSTVPQPEYNGIHIYYYIPACEGKAICSGNTVSGFHNDIWISMDERCKKPFSAECKNNIAESIAYAGDVTLIEEGNKNAAGDELKANK